MSFELERVIVSACQQSWTTLRCVDEGPIEFQRLSVDLAYLSETLQLLSDEIKPPTSVFELATKHQISELQSALDICERNLSSLQTICTSFAQLGSNEQLCFIEETSFTQGARQYLQAKIINYSTSLKELFVTVKISSTTLNWPPNMGILERIQSELLGEGVPVEGLDEHYAEIKNYLRHLAMSGRHVECYSLEPHKFVYPDESLAVISESLPPTCHQNFSSKAMNLAYQFSLLFEPNARRSSFYPDKIKKWPTQKVSNRSPETSEVRSTGQLGRKDSMNPIAASITSRLSAAMSSMSLSVNIYSKSHHIRPPPQRTSSAVFRGLADEERATGE